MLNLRPVLYIIGVLLVLIAAAMLAPALVDYAAGNDDWRAFVFAAGANLFIGGAVAFATRQAEPEPLSVRQALLLTTLTWIVVAGFAALPLVFADINASFIDAYFETMSGLTTTGSTVLVGLDYFPPGILLWRSMLQGLGGIGIIVLGLAVLPFLQVGGMQLFRTESSDRSEKILPRVAQLAGNTLGIYGALVGACAMAYWAAGMSPFDAITHAMPTISTGGFANYDASLGYFASPAIEWIAILFMFAGGVSFAVYIMALHGRPEILWRDSQLGWYLTICLGAAAVLALWRYGQHEVSPHDAARQALFAVVSIVTTSGFVAGDYTLWGSFAVITIFALTFVGGCTGSTAGGIKIFRFQILFATMGRQFFALINPHGVRNPTFEGKPVPPSVPLAVTSFFFLYGISVIAVAGCLGLMGLDLTTSLSGAATTLGNVGPGLGDIIGPAGNFSTLPDAAKVLLSFSMLLGRLELFTVLIILTPSFWRG